MWYINLFWFHTYTDPGFTATSIHRSQSCLAFCLFCLFVLRPTRGYFAFKWTRQHYQWRAAKSRPPKLFACEFWGGKDLYRAMLVVSRRLGFCGHVRGSTTFNRPLRQLRDTEDVFKPWFSWAFFEGALHEHLSSDKKKRILGQLSHQVIYCYGSASGGVRRALELLGWPKQIWYVASEG